MRISSGGSVPGMEFHSKKSAREVTTPGHLMARRRIPQNGGARPGRSTHQESDLGALAVEAVRAEGEYLHVGQQPDLRRHRTCFGAKFVKIVSFDRAKNPASPPRVRLVEEQRWTRRNSVRRRNWPSRELYWSRTPLRAVRETIRDRISPGIGSFNKCL